MRPIHETGLPPAEPAGAAVFGIDEGKGSDDRSNAIVFAEPWAALHNTAIWSSHRPPKPKTNQAK